MVCFEGGTAFLKKKTVGFTGKNPPTKGLFCKFFRFFSYLNFFSLFFFLSFFCILFFGGLFLGTCEFFFLRK